MADPKDGEARMPAFTVRGFVTVIWLAVLLGIGAALGHMSQRSTHHMCNYILLVAGELTFPIGCALVIYAPVRLKHYAGFA